MKVTELVAQIAAPAAEKQGCFVWDVEFVKEAGERYLRLYIDNDEASVNIDQCEAVSWEVDALLDELDPIQESWAYTNVVSPTWVLRWRSGSTAPKTGARNTWAS